MASVAKEAADLSVNGTLSAEKIFELIEDTQKSVDVGFVLVSAYLVFMMQAGFAMLTAGSVRSKNTKGVLLKNILDACVVAIAFYSFGYSLAFGPESNSFIGWGNFALSSHKGEEFGMQHSWFFQWAFAATTATIVSGAVAERTSFYAYLTYAFLLTSIAYPIVVHWVWGGGWLSTLFGVGVIDFAGCIVVHMVGGFAGIAGAMVVGPRLGRFDMDGRVVPIPGHSATLCTLGVFILWFGWYGFNPGSAFGISGELRDVAARAAVNTTLAASAGGAGTLFVCRFRDGIFDLLSSLNGLLAGLVSITASCAFVDGWAAIVIGFTGACFFLLVQAGVLGLKVDDPLDAFAVHGACGFWGAMAAALFNRQIHQAAAGYSEEYWGLFYGGGGRLLAANLVGAIAVAAWTLALVVPVFFAMKVIGILRISAEEEMLGNDITKHGGVAYPMDLAAAADKMGAESIEEGSRRSNSFEGIVGS